MDEREDRPWVIELDLDRLAPGRSEPWGASRRPFASDDPELDRLGRASGEALALVELARRDDPPFVLAVGEAVRRGLPTASRTSVVARSPLSGLVADGQVGSDLARRLAALGDAFVLRGRARGNVLVLDEDGASVELVPDLAGLEPREAHARLEARFGAAATLSIGRAGELGVPIANLAACSSGTGAAALAHYVGRGGLGAAFAARGLKALVVRAPAIETTAHPELVRWLLASPRLAARANEGTLELPESYAARGDLFARGGSVAVDREQARRFAESLDRGARASHGCRGCPTPCGVVLEGARGERRGARFSAGHALGLNLGLEHGDDAFLLLAACDRAGLDAKELGAGLALVARARAAGTMPGAFATIADAPRFGDRDALLACIEATAEGRGIGALLARGVASVARELGLDAAVARGQAVRRERSLASLLGQCVAARGPDPMRTFPFLATDAASRARLVALVAPLALPALAEDPDAAAGKGRLVWWHENLAAALDVAGFCAFSAGALLADGTVTLDELARVIAPRAWRSDDDAGWRLLDGGARTVAWVRVLERRFGAAPDVDRAAFASAELALPGMLDEYLALREPADATADSALSRARRFALDANQRATAESAPSAPLRSDAPREPRALGRVRVVASGALAAGYGGDREVELGLPCDVAAVLRALEASRVDGPALFAAGSPVPAVFRDGKRLEPDATVRAGDRLDLVLAISGG